MKKVSDGELLLLKILWDKGPLTVRDLFDQVKIEKDIGYTTILKQLQRMHQKDIVSRKYVERVHIYKAKIKQKEVKDHLFAKIVKMAFGGSNINLAIHALGNHKATLEEIAEVEKWIEQQKNNL